MTLLSELNEAVERKLATKRLHANGKWAIFKYSKRVFFDGLWGAMPVLEEARGIVVDVNTGDIVQYPFTKVYNYGERGAGDDLSKDTIVQGVVKVNGFLAAVSVRDGELLITTSGSFESPFVEYAREMFEAHQDDMLRHFKPGVTYMFEVCHRDDPHIVPEFPGVVLIGARANEVGSRLWTEQELDVVGYYASLRRPKWFVAKISDIEREIKTNQDIEGYMVRSVDGDMPVLFKWKTKTYLTTKFLARATYFLVEDFDRASLRQKVEEEFYDLIDAIFDDYGYEAFKAFTPEERVARLRSVLIFGRTSKIGPASAVDPVVASS